MGLHDGHRQRCKRRYLAAGAEGMDDHQLLELLLFFAIPRQDTNETERTGVYFMELLAGEKKELLYQVCLDGKGKLLSCRCISKGSVGASPVYVRQVVENALYAGASGIILAHNHPSGVALPSAEDRMVTRQVMEALEPLGIRLIDHIVVADNDFVSMAESKLM